MQKRPIIVIDGMNYFIRFFAVNESMTTSGEPCGGVVGFIKAIYSLTLKFSPQKIYVVWEQGGGCPRRKKIFPEYKANRTKTKSNFADLNKDPKDLPSKRWIMDDKENKLKQVKILVDALKNLPVCQLYISDTECDDVIGYLIRHKLKSEDALKIIISSDRDFYQLLDEPNVKIFNPADKSFHDGPVVKVRLGKNAKTKEVEYAQVPARNYVLVRTLTGDDSDGIPGVPGLGFKTALKAFPFLAEESIDHSVEKLLEASQARLNEDKKKALKIYSSVLDSSEDLKRNWQLMYLDSTNLAASQINKIEYSVDNFDPKLNKLGLIKHLLSNHIVSDINFDLLTNQMQTTLMV